MLFLGNSGRARVIHWRRIHPSTVTYPFFSTRNKSSVLPSFSGMSIARRRIQPLHIDTRRSSFVIEVKVEDEEDTSAIAILDSDPRSISSSLTTLLLISHVRNGSDEDRSCYSSTDVSRDLPKIPKSIHLRHLTIFGQLDVSIGYFI